ncbi:MAG: hypothetical protein DMG24_13545 [Acidobacteria bacterium]|nr:MAG: hypothetical protein DMG24_13545 [Acidobacteriota bacterium]
MRESVHRKGPREEGTVVLRPSAKGVTLLETMVALAIAAIGLGGLCGVLLQATATSQNQGKERTRATIYAQDKIEKLLSLDFAGCSQFASLQPAACNTTGISDAGWTEGLLAGGEVGPVQTTCAASGVSVGYMDLLDSNGTQLSGSCSRISGPASYVRMWTITDLAPFTGGPALKQITVAVYAEGAVSPLGGKPIVEVTSVLSNPQ